MLTLLPEVEATPVDLWPEDRLGDLIGGSPGMRELYATIVRVAASDASVLVHGETGTGKELVARAIHDCSHRAAKPLVVVDCAALPESLLEAELFGHARGAFTGAVARAPARSRPPKGARCSSTRSASCRSRSSPSSCASSSRAPCAAWARRGSARSTRGSSPRPTAICGAWSTTAVPRGPLLPRRRPPGARPAAARAGRGLARLVEHFAPTMAPDARAALCEQLRGRRLAGNVRELRNVVERAVLLGRPHLDDATPSATSDAPPAGDDALPFDGRFHDFQRAAERAYLRRLLVAHGGEVAEAAERSGLNRTYLYRLLKKHAL